MPHSRFRQLAHVCRRLAAVALLAAAVPAHASLMLAQPPYRPKDFCVIKKDGQFHIFYIRHDTQKTNEQTEKDFGHAVSADMYSWYQLPAVIPVRDDNWDNYHVWAPTIVQMDSVYYMLYTGVTQGPGPVPRQRTGLATSTDLVTWNRLDQPVYTCRDVPWSWCDSLNSLDGFRDPFVMPDPSTPGRWLMYYSTFPAADTAGMIVGVATSDGDFTRWTDLKPLWITNEQYSYNPLVESPHLFKHGNLWFLFFTTNAGQPISYCIGQNPTGDPSEWVYKGRLGNMLGIDTHTWYASEHFSDGIYDFFAYANYNRIEMYKMFWTGAQTFVLFEPGDFHVQSLLWSGDNVTKGSPATLSVVATGWSGRQVNLQAAERMPDGSEQSIPIGSVGLPAQLDLTADTTRFDWTAEIHHASGDTVSAQTIVIRTTDLTAEARPITVTPPPPPPPPFQILSLEWGADSVHVGDAVTLRLRAVSWTDHQADLQAVERLTGGGEVALDMGSLGLPSTIPLAADTTLIPWVARIRRASGDTTSALSLVVRDLDFGVEAPVLHVTQPPSTPPTFKVESIRWGADSVLVGSMTTLCVVASGWSGHSVSLEAVEPGGGDSLLAIADLGLPATLALTGDTTRFAWSARIRRASGDTTTALELVVRTTDHTVESPALRVIQPPLDNGGSGSNDPRPKPLKFKMLIHSVLGDEPAFLVELPSAARVRLDLFDLQGRRVRSLADRELPPGASVIGWDGRDRSGAPAGRGLYFARLVTPFATRVVKVMLTRPIGVP